MTGIVLVTCPILLVATPYVKTKGGGAAEAPRVTPSSRMHPSVPILTRGASGVCVCSLQGIRVFRALSGAGAPSHATTQSWYEAMAQAWGTAMNNQAQVITNLSDQINTGQDTPAQITQLTAESLRFSYLATNASTSTSSVGDGLETLGRKQ
jgi:hypothetical protein